MPPTINLSDNLRLTSRFNTTETDLSPLPCALQWYCPESDSDRGRFHFIVVDSDSSLPSLSVTVTPLGKDPAHSSVNGSVSVASHTNEGVLPSWTVSTLKMLAELIPVPRSVTVTRGRATVGSKHRKSLL